MRHTATKLSLFFVACAAAAQDSAIDRVLRQLEQVHAFSSVSISPDGKWVTWGETVGNNSRHVNLYLLDWKDPQAKPRRITAGDGEGSLEESGIAWSPDSNRFAFLSNAGSSQKQVFAGEVGGGKPRRLTNLSGFVTDVRWSSDGRQIAFLYAAGGGGGGPLQAAPIQTGVIGSEIHNQRITVVNAAGGVVNGAGGEVHPLTDERVNVYEYDWSPDGKQFVATAAPGPADNNWWIAQLYVVDAASGKMQVLYHPPAERQLAVPRWSPDGKQIAFVGGLMSDEGFNGGDIFILDRQGGEPRDVTAGRKATPSAFEWQGKERIVFTESVDGGSAISVLKLANGETETLWKGEEGVHEHGNVPNFSLAKDGQAWSYRVPGSIRLKCGPVQ